MPATAQSSAAKAYTFTTFAGRPNVGSLDGAGSAAQFFNPTGVVLDNKGNAYVADSGNSTIRRVTATGMVTTIVGFPGSEGHEDGTNSAARFTHPRQITLDSAGSLYVTDSGGFIRKIVPAGTNWVVSTIAGGLSLDPPEFAGIVADAAGNLYVTQVRSIASTPGNPPIPYCSFLKIAPVGTNWVTTTIAGGNFGSADGVGTNAEFAFSADSGAIALDSETNLYLADSRNNVIRKITLVGSNWNVSTIVGPTSGQLKSPSGIAVDSTGNLFVADKGNTIWKILSVGRDWVVTDFAGSVMNAGSANGTGSDARFASPEGIALDGQGNLYVADSGNNLIRKITPAGVVSTPAGSDNRGSVDGTGSAAQFSQPYGVIVDSVGNIYVADSLNNTIRQITSAGVVNTLAGLAGHSGTTDGVGSHARFNNPTALAVDGSDNVYVADTGNFTVRKITAAGIVTTLAGNAFYTNQFGNHSGGSADGIGTNALFGLPTGVAADRVGNVYVADQFNSTIRQITPLGAVTTIAGSGRFLDSSRDGTGTNAQFYFLSGIAIDKRTNLYVMDGYSVRKVAPVATNWTVTTLAGRFNSEGGADGLGTNAQFSLPQGAAVDHDGNLYVADTGNNAIRKISLLGTNWMVKTIGGLAGTPDRVSINGGIPGISYSGSTDGAGSTARFSSPEGIAVDSGGSLYVADTLNNTIRKGIFTAYTTVNPVSYIQPNQGAQLMVTLLPPEANGQWRFPWELQWRPSGTIATNLAVDNSHPYYTVEVRSLPGWLAFPSSFQVTVTGNGIDSVTTNVYYPTINSVNTNSAGGTLTVNLGANPPSGAGWRFLGDQGTNYLPSGYTTNLLPGTYLIEFAGGFTNRATPSNLSVEVSDGQPTLISVNYSLAQLPPAGVLLPQAVPSTNISDLTDYPFGFNGQLKTDVGYGSGVAVQSNVVLTAAHLVFDDQTLSYVRGAFWYFQRQAGVYEPTPMQAQGWYVLSSYSGGMTNNYAEQRTNDLNSGFYRADQSSPQSRNLDVAALYFSTPVAGGGYGGYLPSDELPNSWLSSTSLKMLVGYPVDGSVFGDTSIVPGVMYQTDPQPYPLSLASDQVDDQQVYVAPWLLSYPGNSGGPFYVQFNGYYYPAGVYLGTLYNGIVPAGSFVRAIDSNVVNMITLAQQLGDAGTNNTGGGVITIVPVQGISGKNLGHIQFHLGPPAVVRAGAGWKLHTDPPDAFGSDPNYTLAVDSTNDLQVEFKPIAGWNLPTNQTVRVFPGPITTNSAFYTVISPVLVADPKRGIGLTGTIDTTYLLQYRTSLTSGIWLPLATNTLGAGFNPLLPWPTTNGSTAFYRVKWLP